jgi:hypothetical protein
VSANRLHDILCSVAGEIATCRAECNGIVFVVREPRPQHLKALRRVNAPLREGTSVFACTCSEAADLWADDTVTRRWCSEPPQVLEVKVFLIIGDRTGLLTINQESGSASMTDGSSLAN